MDLTPCSMQCGTSFDKKKDTYITVNERKAASVDVCSIECAAQLLRED